MNVLSIKDKKTGKWIPVPALQAQGDREFSPESINPQSGIAVAEAIGDLLFTYSATKGMAPKYDIKACNFKAGSRLIFEVSGAKCNVLALASDGSNLELAYNVEDGNRYEITLTKDIQALGMFVIHTEGATQTDITVFGTYLRDVYVDVDFCKNKVNQHDNELVDMSNLFISYSYTKGAIPNYAIKNCDFKAGSRLIIEIIGGTCNVLAKGADGTNIDLLYSAENGQRYEITLTKDIKGLGLFVHGAETNPSVTNVTVISSFLREVYENGKQYEKRFSEIENNLATKAEAVAGLYQSVDFTKTAGTVIKYNNKEFSSAAYTYATADVTGAMKAKINGISLGASDFPLYIILDENNNVIEKAYPDGVVYKVYTDFEISIPANAKTLKVNGNDKVSISVAYMDLNALDRISKITNVSDFGKVLFMGDSITANNSWVPTFVKLLGIKQHTNIAVSNATVRDRSDTIDYDGNPIFNQYANNVLGNQVEKLLMGKDTTHPNYSKVADYDNFDMIIISCGTNDTGYEDVSTIENQFIENGQVVPLERANRKTFAGAMRYCYEKLHSLYPNAQIFFCTPIQESYGGETYQSIKDKGALIKSICERLSVDYIDTFRCGICDIYNKPAANGEDLVDGVHPNTNGALKIARYNAKKVAQKRWMI